MNINDIHESSEDFHILKTTGRAQTATITLNSGEATSEGLNSHPHSDQTIILLNGELEADVGEEHATLRSGQSVIVPAGVKHRFRNTADEPAFAFSVYSPPAYETDDPH
jgi:mannose-6-phosphate isomerase-like protein (cupin superfamily)